MRTNIDLYQAFLLEFFRFGVLFLSEAGLSKERLLSNGITFKLLPRGRQLLPMSKLSLTLILFLFTLSTLLFCSMEDVELLRKEKEPAEKVKGIVRKFLLLFL